jgi:hypothetical protein
MNIVWGVVHFRLISSNPLAISMGWTLSTDWWSLNLAIEWPQVSVLIILGWSGNAKTSNRISLILQGSILKPDKKNLVSSGLEMLLHAGLLFPVLNLVY